MRRLTLALLVVASIGLALGTLATLPLLIMSPVLFDAAPPRGTILAPLVIAGLLAFPLLGLLAVVRGWLAFRRGADRDARTALLFLLVGAGLTVTAMSMFAEVCQGHGELGCR